ncbi:lipase family protein [Streptomyces sp. NPDC060194]|uniref:lipase family protein n=1 Tax=Streptomyces sp. NPDC060194 TaxID=3347069 RepID=UPI003659F2EB
MRFVRSRPRRRGPLGPAAPAPAARTLAALALSAALSVSGPVPAARAAPPPEPTGAAGAAGAADTTGAAAPTATDRPPARPGDVVSVEPTAFRVLPLGPVEARAWRIRYRSTTATGAPNTVSGTVLVPDDDHAGPRPLVGYAVGTVGLADPCAPSAAFPRGTAVEGPLIQGLLRRGWAVAVTDYEGLGTPGEHTYTVGRSAGHAVLDAVRAALRLPEAGLRPDAPVGVMGYSQGGQAAGWAAELHASYAPELDLAGTAAGGVPGDLAETARANDGGRGSALVWMSLSGQDAAFPELRLDDDLNPAGRALLGHLRAHCVALGSTVGSSKRLADLTVRDPLGRPDWQRRLGESAVGTDRPDRPVYLYHAREDELIPYDAGRRIRADWCRRGAAVRWRAVEAGGHVDAALAESPRAADWLSDRFAGVPEPGDC